MCGRFILPVLFLACIIPASALEYEVSGRIEQTIYEHDGSVGALEKSQFTVYVKNCAWLIQTIDEGKDGNPYFIRETSCSNGKEIYEVEGKINKGQQNGVRDWNMATIVSNTVPVGQYEGYFVSHLWLMLASGCYFSNLATNWLTPVYDVNASLPVDPNMKREAKWELVNGSGSLPMKVIYLERGFTNATYAATGVTNVGDIKIPSGFVFEFRGNPFSAIFAPGPIAPGESAPAYRVRKRAVATVTAVKPVCSRSDLSPKAEGMTMVIDQRPTNYLADAQNLPTYIVKEGVQWLPLEQAQKSYVARRIPPETPSCGIVAILLLLPTAALFLFLWMNRKKG
jgi:hypothetical protein